MGVAKCELCGEPMPEGETMFKYHGYSGPCPKPPLPKKRPTWIDAAAKECADSVLVGGGEKTFAEIIERHANKKENEMAKTKKTYLYHKPSIKSIETIQKLRSAFADLHELIEHLVPDSRERSVGLTSLETSAMWAIKGVVCNDSASVVEE